MRIIAIIDDAGVIERILKHLSVWDPQPESRSPAESHHGGDGYGRPDSRDRSLYRDMGFRQFMRNGLVGDETCFSLPAIRV